MKPYQRRGLLEDIFTERSAAGKTAQFGQKHDTTTDNGSEACTHVSWGQDVIYLYTGEEVTIDEISAATGYRMGDEGMNSGHVDRMIAHWKLPYVATFRQKTTPTTGDILRIARETGPVMMAVNYGYYPLDKDIGSPGINGHALRGGRNDLAFAGIHAVLLFTARWRKRLGEYRPRVSDPDHGSPSRPHVPAFDVMTQAQLAKLWNTSLNGKPYGHIGYIPTREWEGVPK